MVDAIGARIAEHGNRRHVARMDAGNVLGGHVIRAALSAKVVAPVGGQREAGAVRQAIAFGNLVEVPAGHRVSRIANRRDGGGRRAAIAIERAIGLAHVNRVATGGRVGYVGTHQMRMLRVRRFDLVGDGDDLLIVRRLQLERGGDVGRTGACRSRGLVIRVHQLLVRRQLGADDRVVRASAVCARQMPLGILVVLLHQTARVRHQTINGLLVVGHVRRVNGARAVERAAAQIVGHGVGVGNPLGVQVDLSIVRIGHALRGHERGHRDA